MLRAGAAVLMALSACGGGGSSTDDGPVADANFADGTPPPPQCDNVSATGPDGLMPGTLASPSPTVRSLTLLWPYSGDVNENATSELRYRQSGGTWRQAAPLFQAPAGLAAEQAWDNRFSGSILGLAPNTLYELEATVRDPDGGCETQTVMVSTRAVPTPMANAPVVPVTPATFLAALGAVQPGDVLELGSGSYAGFTVETNGTSAAPIVIRAAAAANVQITGDVRLDARQFVHVVGLVIQGKIKFNGGVGIALIGNTITTTEDGITTKTIARDAYIADNVVIGATSWNEASLGVEGNNVGDGIEVIGSGHVIEHNRVSGFRDCISFIEQVDAEQYSIDIYRNDLSECADDAIEADFCEHNCRIVENRMTNSFIAMSSQPGLGGPTYFVRNVVYNTLLTSFKLHRGSVGDVIIGNTIVKRGDALGIYVDVPYSRTFLRNNLFIGGAGGTYGGYDIGNGRIMELRTADTSTSSMDYDGFFSSAGFSGRLGAVEFSSLAELQAGTTEVHAVQLNGNPFATMTSIPNNPFPAAAIPDLRLAASSNAVDSGVRIPNLAHDYQGTAPDLGAYELGAATVDYGPRK